MCTRLVATLFLVFAAIAGPLACDGDGDGEPTDTGVPPADVDVAAGDTRSTDTRPAPDVADVADTVADTTAPPGDTAAAPDETAAAPAEADVAAGDTRSTDTRPAPGGAVTGADTTAPSESTAAPPEETAAPPAESPKAFIQRQTEIVTELFAEEPSPRRAERFSEKVREIFDFRMLASQALGGHWEARSEEERQQFLSLLQELVEANYKKRLKDQAGGEDVTVEYLDVRQRGDRAFVQTLVKWGETEKKREPVSYKLVRQNGEWAIYDVVIDDVSLVVSYRDSYTKIIEEEGWEALLEKMKQRIDELQREGGGEAESPID